MNVAYLINCLFETAIGEGIHTENTIVSNARHYDALRRADATLADVLEGLSTQRTGDLIALDIRSALRDLGEITGNIGTEDLLDSIFSKFCIGK
jgi:tRNA modification GTPase